MREFKSFVKYHGEEYGLPSMKVIRSVMKISSGIIQDRERLKNIDKETGEIK
uniref:hypothetical protein n=1 Tax=Lactococcus sp. TaxID=44273 RepID=UPI003D6BAE3B